MNIRQKRQNGAAGVMEQGTVGVLENWRAGSTQGVSSHPSITPLSAVATGNAELPHLFISPSSFNLHPSSFRSAALARPLAGFTLAEVLMVVTIMLVLIGMLMGGIQKAAGLRRHSRASVELAGLYNAFRAYFSDYGQYPYTDEAVHVVDNGLVQMLTGGSGLGNTKQRVYLDINASQTNSAGAFVDPWGNPYQVLFDGTGSAADGAVTNPFTAVGYTNRVSVLVWSLGPDGQADTAGEMSDKNKDNVKSY